MVRQYFKFKNILARSIDVAISIDELIQARRDCYVFSYHRVLTQHEAEQQGVHHSLWITPEALSSQIQWMKQVGRIIDYSCLNAMDNLADLPLFILTFDDGWKDNYENAFPILVRHQAPALVFLATEAIESGALFWPQDIATKTQLLLLKGQSERVIDVLLKCWPSQPNRLRYCKRGSALEMVECWIECLKLLAANDREMLIADYYRGLHLCNDPLTGFVMSWDEAREMQNNGISFGSHTHRHTILEDQSPDQIEFELLKSKSLIADKLQVEIDSFCYPNGRYDGREEAILSKCGYKYGFCLDNLSLKHCKNNYYIPRFLVSERKAANNAYFKLCLLEAPLYRSKPHKTNMVKP